MHENHDDISERRSVCDRACLATAGDDMSKGWGWWVLGAVACILLGAMWAVAGTPAAYPGLRATMSNLVEWLETHDGAITALATIAIAGFTYTLYRSTEKLWKAGEQQIALELPVTVSPKPSLVP